MFELIAKIRDDVELLDRRALLSMIYAAAGLTCIFYFKDASFLQEVAIRVPVMSGLVNSLLDTHDNNLRLLGYWVFVSVIFYVAIPAFIVKAVYKRQLADYGMSLKLDEGFGPLLLQSAAVMLPLTYLMSLTAGFSAKYPFLRVYNGEPYLGSTLLIWELIYFFQFFGLEFFFRGFLLHSLKPALGAYAIFVMMVPYCMIHFGKPMPEAFAAIMAGVFLGWLSYRNGNIWLGLVLHCLVAFSMDLLALYNKGLLF
jgi:membrane protease YdiL (CAAX protease family)